VIYSKYKIKIMTCCQEITKTGINSGTRCGRVLVNNTCRYHGKQLPGRFGKVVNKITKKQIKQERIADTCSICLEEVAMYNFKKYEGIHIMNCGHKMHGKCYMNFLSKCENNSSCPLCRKKQLEINSNMELRKLQTKIRELYATLSNIQNTLREEEENSRFWMDRYRKWKNKYKELLGDYNTVLASQASMQNMSHIHQTMIYNLQILNSDLAKKVRGLTQELNSIEEDSE